MDLKKMFCIREAQAIDIASSGKSSPSEDVTLKFTTKELALITRMFDEMEDGSPEWKSIDKKLSDVNVGESMSKPKPSKKDDDEQEDEYDPGSDHNWDLKRGRKKVKPEDPDMDRPVGWDD